MTEKPYHKRRWLCARCGKSIVTAALVSLCWDCRKLARMRNCPLCGEWFDPYIPAKRAIFEICEQCKPLYRRARSGYFVPQLGKPERKAPRRRAAA